MAIPEKRLATAQCVEEPLDVVIVGAGAAGVGCAVVLKKLGITRFKLLERFSVGASFTRWPKEMRFITPSFMSNGFGLLDLNAVALKTSPAYFLKNEHPSGPEYARYLQALVSTLALPVHTGIDVHAIQPDPDGHGFSLETSSGCFRSRFVIWAAGEFQYPRLEGITGAQLCLHVSQVHSWRHLPGKDMLIIGGYESGIDAATHLVALGKRARVIEKSWIWQSEESDPSLTLSPNTQERFREALRSGLLGLIANTRVTRVIRTHSGYAVETECGEWLTTPTPPILATGFTGSLQLISGWLEWNESKQVVLTDEDESTCVPGLFVVGPYVRHEDAIFCFIYKFRQRFALVANTIAKRLGLDTSLMNYYRENNMLLEKLSCCMDSCIC